MRYEPWMDHTEIDHNGRMVPKKDAPAWVVEKINEFYKELERMYPQPIPE